MGEGWGKFCFTILIYLYNIESFITNVTDALGLSLSLNSGDYM